jgi:hypothetical protein
VGEVMRFVREGAASRPDGEDFAHGCAELRVEGKFRGKEFGLAAVDGEGGGAEQVLKGPAGGEVEADAADGLADAGADFEELSAQGFDLRRAPGPRQLQTEKVDQVVGGGVQQQAEGVGQRKDDLIYGLSVTRQRTLPINVSIVLRKTEAR